jgi:hypothetical protein
MEFYQAETRKFNAYTDPSGLTLEQIRQKLREEDPSKFRQVMEDLKYTGEEP